MDMLTLMDRVRDGAYRADRFPVTDEVAGVAFTYTLEHAMQHAQTILRGTDPEADWQGVITPACHDRTRTEVVSRHVGIGLRIGGEASLCFDCGPDGGHYHPSEGESMDTVMTVAARLADIKES